MPTLRRQIAPLCHLSAIALSTALLVNLNGAAGAAEDAATPPDGPPPPPHGRMEEMTPDDVPVSLGQWSEEKEKLKTEMARQCARNQALCKPVVDATVEHMKNEVFLRLEHVAEKIQLVIERLEAGDKKFDHLCQAIQDLELKVVAEIGKQNGGGKKTRKT